MEWREMKKKKKTSDSSSEWVSFKSNVIEDSLTVKINNREHFDISNHYRMDVLGYNVHRIQI